MRFDWHGAKAAANRSKHGVDFRAMDGFDWATALVRADTRRDYGEIRLTALGLIEARLFHLTFTIRRDTVWIISLRKASNREIDRYEAEAEAEQPGGGGGHPGGYRG